MLFQVEILALAIVVSLQVVLFFMTASKIQVLGKLFPSFELDVKNIKQVEVNAGLVEQIDIVDHKQKEFQNIVSATNAYLNKNLGSADFGIIRNITERIVEAQEARVSNNISLPLYVGLMGTFLGVILGLFSLAANAEFGSGEINSFLMGVIIAMCGSFFGLLLTTINNSGIFKKARAKRDKNKNQYFNFLQTELLPNLDNSLYSAIASFKSNLNDFNSVFSRNVEVFGTSFSYNIDNLKKSVLAISENVEIINSGSQIQAAYLEQLRKSSFAKITENSISLIEKLGEAAPLLGKFVDKQTQLNNSIGQINLFADRINSLLNRISDFEDGLNKVGKEMRASDMIGNEMIVLVQRQINAISSKEKLIEDYSIKSSDEMKSFLQTNLERLEAMTRNLELSFGKTFDFEAEENVLNHLSQLPKIENVLTKIESSKVGPELLVRIQRELQDVKQSIAHVASIVESARSEQRSLKTRNSSAPLELPKEVKKRSWSWFGLRKRKKNAEAVN